ncbi:MAG TPA: nucleoside monophosphate kinase, partial [Rudaea sp.]|nr:nucleoside monophosphate kinase [Rudaea sp.]
TPLPGLTPTRVIRDLPKPQARAATRAASGRVDVFAAALETLLDRLGQPLDVAIKLDVPDSAILSRCEIRFAAEHRKDDDPAIVRKRLDVYRAQTEPVAEHFAQIGKLKTVDGVGNVDQVFQRILAALPR